MNDAKTCYTCAHRSGARCTLTGLSCAYARHKEEEPCNRDWSGWTPRPVERNRPCLLVRLVRLFVRLRKWGL